MSTDGSDWEGEGGEEFEEPVADRPYGARPYGARPYGARPYGARPYGARPYGARPYGARPYGARPYGARPYGARPYGARPYDEGAPRSPIDPVEWGEDIGELVLSHSAVVRLGATVVSSDADLWIPTANATVRFRQPGEPLAKAPDAEAAAPLSPRDWSLEAWLSVPTRLFRSLASNPELAYTLKGDLAEGLARGLDSAVLVGPPPGNVAAKADGVEDSESEELLGRVGDVVTAVRTRKGSDFRRPGWILHPTTLDGLMQAVPPDSSARVLALDGADGGMLVGFPFVASPAAVTAQESSEPRIYFAADWRDAVVGVGERPVTVDTPAEPKVADGVALRASMTLDVTLRRNVGFAWIAPVR